MSILAGGFLKLSFRPNDFMPSANDDTDYLEAFPFGCLAAILSSIEATTWP